MVLLCDPLIYRLYYIKNTAAFQAVPGKDKQKRPG